MNTAYTNNSPNINTVIHNNANNNNPNNADYFIEENEGMVLNQISNMNIKSNNLNRLNTIETNFGFKSFTDPSCEDFYYDKTYPSFFYSNNSENEQIASSNNNRMFPFIEEKRNSGNNDDSFDYTNLNEEYTLFVMLVL